MTKIATVILAEGFEEIEAVTSIDILRRADIDVTVCGLDKGVVTGSHNIKILADMTLAELKISPDAVVLPGGMPGAANLANAEEVNRIITKMHNEKRLIAAICAAPAVVLAPAGILKGKKATCYPGMEERFGKDTQFRAESVVVDGDVITSQGPGTAILFALAIVEKLKGKAAADNLRKKTLV